LFHRKGKSLLADLQQNEIRCAGFKKKRYPALNPSGGPPARKKTPAAGKEKNRFYG
jgi:hypothetical protein